MDGEKRSDETTEEETKFSKRFPTLPDVPELPNVPKVEAKLPPRPSERKGSVEPGSYNKMAIAATAASSFIMPIIVLSVGGWWLDQKLKHETAWFAFCGVLVGFVVGTSALLNVIKRLSDDK